MAKTIRTVAMGVLLLIVLMSRYDSSAQTNNGSRNLPRSCTNGQVPVYNSSTGQWACGAGGGGGDAVTTNPLSQFAATTSAQLRGVISDETGSGAAVFGTSPTFTTGVTVTGGTLTGSSAPLYTDSQTWNNGATTFKAIQHNVTNTASVAGNNNADSGSTLEAWAVGGTDVVKLNYQGRFVLTPRGGLGGSSQPSLGWIGGGTVGFDYDTTRNHIYIIGSGATKPGAIGNGGFNSASDAGFKWSANTDGGANPDTGLCRNAAGVVEMNNGTCGTLRDYKYRHSLGGGTAPTVADTSANSCGSGTETIAGSDERGRVTVIGSSGTSCTVTFGTAYGTAPVCFAADETSGVMLAPPVTTTTTTILAGTFAQNDVIRYSCGGY